MKSMINKALLAGAAAALLLGGCATALKLTEDGEKVRVLGVDLVAFRDDEG